MYIEFEIEKMLDQVRDGKMTPEVFVNKCEAIINNFNKELEKQAAYEEQESRAILEAETHGDNS